MDEYIKRSEVIDLVEKEIKKCSTEKTTKGVLVCAHLRTAVMGLRSADVAPRADWISVEERWPETDGYYLVWNKEQRKIEIRFFHRLPPHYPVETYPEIRAYFGNCSDHKSITHWMPMPEPPKGGCHE